MKWLIGIVMVMVMTMTGCVSTPAKADARAQFVMEKVSIPGGNQAILARFTNTDVTTTNNSAIEMLTAPAKVNRASVMQKMNMNTIAMLNVINALKKRVHKTWYVFSGATPRGWDCSGLVLWAYEQLGVELPHRASEQKLAGTLTKNPQPGDIVAFTYKGSKSAYHVGIYLGEDKMIDAPRPGMSTQIESISAFAGKWSKVTYTHILDTIL